MLPGGPCGNDEPRTAFTSDAERMAGVALLAYRGFLGFWLYQPSLAGMIPAASGAKRDVPPIWALG